MEMRTQLRSELIRALFELIELEFRIRLMEMDGAEGGEVQR